MPITIYDISKMAGVSTATVSRVFNGSQSVKPATRKKVMDVIEKYGYTPNAFARGMGLRSARTVGILCADSSDLFLAKAVYFLEQKLQENGYEALLCCTGYNLDIKKNYLSLMLSKGVDSIILVGSNFIGPTELENQYINEAATQVPIMLLNASYDCENVYSIFCDDYHTMYDATKAMQQSGISDIIYLYSSNSYSGKKKLEGFQAAMTAAGLTSSLQNTFYYDGNLEQLDDITDFIESIATSGVSFHGVIASEDALAIGSIKYAQRHNIIVPDELSVIGYNNSILTSCCTPELTSIDNRLETMTHQLVNTLLHLLSGEEMPTKSIFSGQLVQRGTTML